MKSKLAMFLFLAVSCCAGQPAYAATEHEDGSITLTKEEKDATLRNFNFLINSVNALQAKIKALEAEQQCKGV